MGKDLHGKNIGKGFSQRKDGRYTYRKMVDGQKIEICNTNLATLRREVKKAPDPKPRVYRDVTFRDWYEEWFRDFKAPILKNDSCRATYHRKIKHNYLELLGDKKVREITQRDIQLATNDVAKMGYCSKTIRENLGIVRECLKVAILNNIIDKNPCEAIGLKTDYKMQDRRRVMTVEEEREFLEEAKNSEYSDLFHIMLLTGMRIGELSGLKIDDIDFGNRVIHVRRQLVTFYDKGQKHCDFSTPKSNMGFRDIPFFSGVEKYLHHVLSNRKKATEDRFKDLVFLTSRGTPVNRYNLAQAIDKIVDNINNKRMFAALQSGGNFVKFEPLYPHAFRHTFCTRLFEKGMNPVVVQRIMGHTNYRTTLSYTHTNDDYLCQAADQVGRLF